MSSEFRDGMYSWFKDDWIDIKSKVYEIVDMNPKHFEGEISDIINNVEKESKHLLKFPNMYACYFDYLSICLFCPFLDV